MPGDKCFDETLGLSEDGLNAALSIRDNYRNRQPICAPGERARILVPENLLNPQLDLRALDDPLPLALMAVRDPEASMALAAAARLSPLAGKGRAVPGVVGLVEETSKHKLVTKCLHLITSNAFDPDTIGLVRRHAATFVAKSRQRYTAALRENLRTLLTGDVAPRAFVRAFFELTEAGNLRNDIRRKLVVSLLLSENVRPSIKFLILENFTRLPRAVRLGIISAVMAAEPTHHIELIKEELHWIVSQGGGSDDLH